MEENKMLDYIKQVLENMPSDWLKLTTHRLDIYDEQRAKTEFVEQFEALFEASNTDSASLAELRTAYDYIRLGHPLSCILEWAMARLYQIAPEQVISFSSQTTPLLAVLRKNLLDNKQTQILYRGAMPAGFDAEIVRKVYGYHFDLKALGEGEAIPAFEGSTVLIETLAQVRPVALTDEVDFYISLYQQLGSIIVVPAEKNLAYISEIQHVRRRETIAMTPENTRIALQQLRGQKPALAELSQIQAHKSSVLASIQKITDTQAQPLVASSGLSMQYAIMMGLVHEALEKHPGKNVKILVPPNSYGGTNDQARRMAACVDQVQVMDLPVDGDNDMVQSIDQTLEIIAREDAIPYIIAEIPTNPRVEVPNLDQLTAVLTKTRQTKSGQQAIDPVFILDQTFCPNVLFLGENDRLSAVRTIAYVSGSKFPSGGRVTAGYAGANQKAAPLMDKIALHLQVCDNEATALQYELLAEQLPSMNARIAAAYKNTREYVNYIQEVLPAAKINFVSEALATQGFTPSVFSLDLPTKGDSDEAREQYKRALNLKLINMMITEIPNESKYCVSYGQLKGCYWTIPATSTQGTTKEGDKDYIARVALSADMDLARHKQVFADFVNSI